MAANPSAGAGKVKPFDVDEVFARLEQAVEPFEKAALFVLAEEGHRSLFEVLVGCVISIRTLDEVTIPTARRLFKKAHTPQQVTALSAEQIDKLIATCSFHAEKARQIHAIAEIAVREHEGQLPADFSVLTGFRGIGPKCANLILGIATGKAHGIGVDIHVHRITNRWGYVRASAPEGTRKQLEARLPQRYWIEINRLLVPFGKHICTGRLPRCSTCPLLQYCDQAGVTKHR